MSALATGRCSQLVAVVVSHNTPSRGSCVSKIIGTNVARLHAEAPAAWSPEVRMWVYEEVLADGTKLTDCINGRHENVKYLPGILLPHNVVAEASLVEAVRGATLLVFVVPHQFVDRICSQLEGAGVLAAGARAISLIKGIDCEASAACSSAASLETMSERIGRRLGLDVSVLMGANLASDIAREHFSEATIGFRDAASGALWRALFETSYFRMALVEDVTGVELCGALKNIIAVAAGLVDGLFPRTADGASGGADNTKAAVMRRGLLEMRALCRLVDPAVREETFLESCGVADLITSSYGGRNRRIGEAIVATGRPFEELEAALLNGQKVQGPPTARQVHAWLAGRQLADHFPIMTAVYRICYEGRSPATFLSDI